MADIIYPHEGNRYAILNVLFGTEAVEINCFLKLYTNTSLTPSVDTVRTDLTELSGSGYGRKTFGRGSWTITRGTQTSRACIEQGAQLWSFTSSGLTAYGWYIEQYLGGLYRLVVISKFDQPKEVFNGATLTITPKLYFGTLAT